MFRLKKGFGTIVAERIADMLVMLLIILITLILQFEFIIEFFSKQFNTSIFLVLGIGVALLGIGFLIFRKSESAFVVKIKTFFRGLMEGVFSILKMKKKWAFIGHTLFIWGLYILMFYTTTYAFDSLEGIPIAAILIGFFLLALVLQPLMEVLEHTQQQYMLHSQFLELPKTQVLLLDGFYGVLKR